MNKFTYLLVSAFILLLISSCSNNHDQLMENIKAKEKIVSESTTDIFDKSTAESLRNDYIEFANEYPEDSLAPIFLHKASELAINLNMPQEAVSTIDTLIKRFPDYTYLPDAWFFKGFIQETYLNNQAEALKTYQSFVQKFPNHEMIPQVQFSIDNLGKSADELMDEFMQNNQQIDTISILPDSV